ncbi:MAG: S41 family peptidase [Gammaproteobacteria bacterium]
MEKGVVHDGEPVIRIERQSGSPSQFSQFDSCVQMDFRGETVELRGFLKTKNVSSFAGLWIREDSDETALAINNMQQRNLNGSTGWTEYSVALPYKSEGRRLVFGALLVGTGKVWVSGLQLLVDGKPIWEAPHRELVKTVLDTDRQFDKGSGIVIKQLSQTQIDNLVTLGKVWGFLKYYDPEVTSGHWQWDYELFRVLPAILNARDRVSANAILVKWIDDLGPVVHCNPCAHLDAKDLELKPDLAWIDNVNLLGTTLSWKLRSIRDNRKSGTQFFVSLTPGVGNPIFKHERSYRFVAFPDAGFQLLALYRFWNIVEYWYPDRNVIGENWDDILKEFTPRFALAKDRTDYELQLMRLIALVHDTHANLWSSLNVRPPVGTCHLPVRLRFIQDQPVVTGYMDGTQASNSPFQVGDVITSLDGSPVAALVKKWSPYYADSNEAARRRDIATFMSRGACGATAVGIRRGDRNLSLKAARVPVVEGDLGSGTQDLPGPAFRLLSPQVAYLKLSAVKAGDAVDYVKEAAGTKGLIIDIRNYPSQPVVGALGSLLVSKVTPFVRYTVGDLSDPGAFHWTAPDLLTPAQPHYKGKVVILVNAITQSSAEFTSMAFRAALEAVVVGSTTAGADGNVSLIPLPGGLHAYISGIGVFYPDRQPTQRVGIVPNVIVEPTIADIREGRDAVLDKAIRLIVGSQVPLAQIIKMYKTQSSTPSVH